MSGKGSTPRPFDIPREVYESNHDRIFGKRERVQYVPPPVESCFGDFKVVIDPSLPPDAVEMRGMNRVRCNLKTGEVIALPSEDEPLVDGYQEKAHDQ